LIRASSAVNRPLVDPSAFGLERVMWGGDWTRVLQDNTYAQDASFITETDVPSESDKEQIPGAALRTVMG
jgi:predicted TIM-barrel fold metal-dependent hydrolase